jgi:hypothetical protein
MYKAKNVNVFAESLGEKKYLTLLHKDFTRFKEYLKFYSLFI